MKTLQQRFPFPLEEDQFRYSNNLKPLNPPCCIQLTQEYPDEVAEKRRLLETHSERCFKALPQTSLAQWEVVDLMTHQLSVTYPEYFALDKDGDSWVFQNHLLGETYAFTFGVDSTLPLAPLNWIGSHVQEDLIIMTQRDEELYLDAGQLCFPSAWSIAFDLGMAFHEIHQPVPWNLELAEKIRRFLLRVEAGQPWTRLNWAMHVGKRLHLAPETFDEWGPARYTLTPDKVGNEVQFRVEEQCVARLPGSQSLLFTIHTYLISLAELVNHREWAHKLYHVLATLPDSVARYKGLAVYRQQVIDYLEKYQ